MSIVRLSPSQSVAEYRNEKSRPILERRGGLQRSFMGRRGDHKGLPFAIGSNHLSAPDLLMRFHCSGSSKLKRLPVAIASVIVRRCSRDSSRLSKECRWPLLDPVQMNLECLDLSCGGSKKTPH